MDAWIPVAVAIMSAGLSGIFAYRANASNHDAARLRDLEARIATRKVEAYDPMLELFRKLLDPRTSAAITEDPDAYADTISHFAQQLTIWGSDDAVIAFQRFMQTTYHAAPMPVMMRHYVEFVLAARRDIGYAKTELTGEHILGVRMNDYYSTDLLRPAMNNSLDDVYASSQWSPPWNQQNKQKPK